MFISGGTFAVSGSTTFQENLAGEGGAMRVINNGLSTMRNTTFQGNGAKISGGALYVYGSSNPLSIVNCVFQSNNAGVPGLPRGSGGAVATQNALLSFSNTVFADNQAQNHGGCLYLGGNSATQTVLAGPSFQSNKALIGGALLYVTDAQLATVSLASFADASEETLDIVTASTAAVSIAQSCGDVALGLNDASTISLSWSCPSVVSKLQLAGAGASIAIPAFTPIRKLIWSAGTLACSGAYAVAVAESGQLTNDGSKRLDNCRLKVESTATLNISNTVGGEVVDLVLSNSAHIVNTGQVELVGNVTMLSQNATSGRPAFENQGSTLVSETLWMRSDNAAATLLSSTKRSLLLFTVQAPFCVVNCTAQIQVEGQVVADGYLVATVPSDWEGSEVQVIAFAGSNGNKLHGSYQGGYVLDPSKLYMATDVDLRGSTVFLVVSPLSGAAVTGIVIGCLSAVALLIGTIAFFAGSQEQSPQDKAQYESL